MEYMDLVDDNDNIIKAVTREYFDKNNSRNGLVDVIFFL